MGLEKETVRAAVAIEDVYQALTGEALRGNGTERHGRCPSPDHADEHPSCDVNVETQQYYCHVCKKGGDVFDFVSRHRGCGFADALAWLADRAGIVSAGPSTATVPSNAPSNSWVYTDLDGIPQYRVDRYDSSNGRKFFGQKRADGNSGFIGGKNAMSGVSRVLYRWPELKGRREVVLVEGEKCADALWQLGIPATTTPGGSGRWYTPPIAEGGYAQQFQRVGVTQIPVFPDADGPGRKHGDAAARACHAAGLKLKVVTLPGLPTGGDVVDFLAAGRTKADLLAAIEAAPTYTPPDSQPDAGGSSTVTADDTEPSIDELLEQCGCCALSAETMQAEIEVALTKLTAAVATASAGRRALVREAAIQALKQVGTVKSPAKVVDAFFSVLPARGGTQGTLSRKSLEHSNTSTEVVIPQGVTSLLGDSNIIRRVDEGFRQGGYAGDDLRPPRLVFVSMTSRLLERPMNIAIVAQSAAGKNRAVDAGAALMPPEALYVERAGSERALIYAGDDFKHRVVIFTEADSIPDEGPAASAIRGLASDNVLAYDVVESNPETKQFETRRIEKPGPTGLITTSTKSLRTQLGTRVLEVPIKDSPEQTRAVVLAQGATAAAGPTSAERDFSLLIGVQHWLEQVGERRIVVPFAPALAELVPVDAVRMRRDFQQLVSCIQTFAFILQLQRARTADGAVVASLEDYAHARDLLGLIFDSITTEGLTPAVRQTVEAVPEVGELSQAKLAKQLKLQNSTVSWRVRRAIKGGWLKNLETKPGHPARLVRGDPPPDAVTALPPIERVREVFESGELDTTHSLHRTYVEAFDCSNGFRETGGGSPNAPSPVQEEGTPEWQLEPELLDDHPHAPPPDTTPSPRSPAVLAMAKLTDALASPAVEVLVGLETKGFELTVVGGHLDVDPGARLSAEQVAKLTEYRDELVLLVLIFDDGTQQRVAVFEQQLANTPAPQIPAFLFQPDVPHVRGHCFSCGAKLAENRFGRCVRCSLAWRLAAGVDLSAELPAAVDEASVA